MPMPSHKYHSWLFAPADDERKAEKALASAADVVILDLEDAVPVSAKQAAWPLAQAALRRESGAARYVRVNDLATGLTADDVAATIVARPDGYVLPKCEGPDDIEALAAMIRQHRPDEAPGILAIATETVRGVRNLMRLDWAHPMLTGLTWGGEDLRADLGALSNLDEAGAYLPPFALARDLALFAAKEAGVLAIDAVFVDFRNADALAAEARFAKSVGFDGKMAIHPAQIDVINRNMAPSPEDVDWARRVIAALREACEGVAQLDGRMLDRPHARLAEKILNEVARRS